MRGNSRTRDIYFAILTGRDEDINTIHFVLCESGGLEIALLRLGRVEDDSLLAINDVLRLLT